MNRREDLEIKELLQIQRDNWIDDPIEESSPQNDDGEKEDDTSREQMTKPGSSVKIDEMIPHQLENKENTDENVVIRERREVKKPSRVSG